MRGIGLTTTLETAGQYTPREGLGGSVLLSQGYYTICDSIPAGDSMFTQGVANYYDFLSDTVNMDTTALSLDAFVGQSIPINMFVTGLVADTLLITYEEAYSYDPPACDSVRAHGSTVFYNRAFWTVDTLFKDSLDLTKDNLIVKGALTLPGPMSRWYRDTINVVAPLMRIKVRNKGKVITTNPIHFELYARQQDMIINGAAGRQQDRWTPPGGKR